MARPSTIDQLPAELRQVIADLREQGVTIDQILGELRSLGAAHISRSALGRHIKGLDALGERLRRSREVADVLARRLGDAPESKQARVNIELLHSVIMDLFSSEDGSAVALDPENVMLLSRSLASLAAASKADADLTLRLREEAERRTKTAAAKAVDGIAREKGLTRETIEAIKARILGVKVA